MVRPLPFDPPIALAPLEGVAGPSMLRAWAAVGGMGLLCQPFLSVSQQPPPARMVARLTTRHGPMAHSTQLLGADPARMAEAAAVIAARGIDLVDLNFGCPSRVILRRGAGAAMLAHPDRLAAIVRAVRDAVRLPLIVKLRLGIDDPAESLGLARAAVEAGADVLALHARTLADRYQGPARWEWIRRVVEAVDVPVLGNGDVWTAEDALRMRAETGCAGVMLGRGALRNPWIFRQIEALAAGRPSPRPGPAELLAFLLPVAADLAAEAERPRTHANRLKELVAHLGTLVDDGGAWRRAVLHEPDLDGVMARLSTLAELRDTPLRFAAPTVAPPTPP